MLYCSSEFPVTSMKAGYLAMAGLLGGEKYSG